MEPHGDTLHFLVMLFKPYYKSYPYRWKCVAYFVMLSISAPSGVGRKNDRGIGIGIYLGRSPNGLTELLSPIFAWRN
jgi:hypothetical protein